MLKQGYRLLAALLPALLLWLVPAAAAAAPEPPPVTARSVFMVNADDGRVLYAKDPDVGLPMASTTKMMTALIVLENCPDLDAVVTVSRNAAQVGESSIWLSEGEQMTVRQLLEGLLIQSGNDAAVALAEYEAGSEEVFVQQMNQKAEDLGLKHTHFMNPHGLDTDGHYASARDLATIGAELMKYPEAREIVAQPQVSIAVGGDIGTYVFENHNHLLGVLPVVNGIKTGYTENAGNCIVVSASQKGVNLIAAYLGGTSAHQRDQEVSVLLQYGFDSYQPRRLVGREERPAAVPIPYSNGDSMELAPESELVKQVHVDADIDYRLVLPDELRLPVHQGDRVGLMEIYSDGELLGRTYLLATGDVPDPGWRGKIDYFLDSVMARLTSLV